MAVDLGNIIGRALENTLDAKGLTYAVADANEIVLPVTLKTDGTWDLSNAVFNSDGEYQVYDLYISDKHQPSEVSGTPQDMFITLNRNGIELIKDYRAILGIKTLYGIHNGDKVEVASIKCPDSSTDKPTDCPAPSADTTYYVHLRVLKLIPA